MQVGVLKWVLAVVNLLDFNVIHVNISNMYKGYVRSNHW